MTKRTVQPKKSGTKRASAQRITRNDVQPKNRTNGVQDGHVDAPSGLAPDEQTAVDQRRKIGIPVSDFGLALVKQMRASGATTESVRAQLRHEAHNLDDLAARLTPEPETRDAMLKDALDVIAAVADIFANQGDGQDLVGEALRSASDDIELFEYASSNGSGGADSMMYIRAQRRIDLALKLAAFRKKHPTWKPAKAESDDEQEEQADAAVSS